MGNKQPAGASREKTRFLPSRGEQTFPVEEEIGSRKWIKTKEVVAIAHRVFHIESESLFRKDIGDVERCSCR